MMTKLFLSTLSALAFMVALGACEKNQIETPEVLVDSKKSELETPQEAVQNAKLGKDQFAVSYVSSKDGFIFNLVFENTFSTFYYSETKNEIRYVSESLDMVFPIYKLSENFEKIPVYEQRRIANLWTAFNHGVESNKAISLDLGGFIEEKVKTVHYSGNIEDEKKENVKIPFDNLYLKRTDCISASQNYEGAEAGVKACIQAACGEDGGAYSCLNLDMLAGGNRGGIYVCIGGC